MDNFKIVIIQWWKIAFSGIGNIVYGWILVYKYALCTYFVRKQVDVMLATMGGEGVLHWLLPLPDDRGAGEER